MRSSLVFLRGLRLKIRVTVCNCIPESGRSSSYREHKGYSVEVFQRPGGQEKAIESERFSNRKIISTLTGKSPSEKSAQSGKMAVDCPSFLVSGLQEPNSQQVPNASVPKLQGLYCQNSGYGSSAPLPFKNTTPKLLFYLLSFPLLSSFLSSFSFFSPSTLHSNFCFFVYPSVQAS